MSTPEGTDHRINRDKGRDELIERLRTDEDSPFSEIRQILLFAACLGFASGRREPVVSRSDSVRWDTLIGIEGAEPVVSMIALADSEDKEIVGNEGIKRALKVFEEYANGGLLVLGERLSSGGLLIRELIQDLVTEALSPASESPSDPLDLLRSP